MRYYHPFELPGDSFAERVGPPDPVSAAVGRMTLNFAVLEVHLATTLIRLLEGDERWNPLLTTGLSFAEKLQLLDERVRLLAPTRAFNTGDIDPLDLFAELRSQCAHAARLRAQVLDPAMAEAILTSAVCWRDRGGRRARRRAPRTEEKNSGAAHLPTSQLGPDRLTDPSVLLDVADFICMVTEDFQQFFMPNRPTAPSSGMGPEGLG
jgi:hypothetical protein